jgi:hypothetical protein
MLTKQKGVVSLSILGKTCNSNSTPHNKKVTVDINSFESTTIVSTSVNQKYPVLRSEDPQCHLKMLLWDDSSLFMVIDRSHLGLRENLAKMTCIVAAKCDRCLTNDGVGFSRIDVERGHEIARLKYIPEDWSSDKVRNWAQRMSKYRNQLPFDFLNFLFTGER